MNKSTNVILAGALVALVGTQASASMEPPPPDRGAWVTVGKLDQARSGHTATLLADGTVFVIGGERGDFKPALVAELVYPESGASRPAGTLPWGTINHHAVALPDGRVVVTRSDHESGWGFFDSGQDRCAEYPPLVWDPATMGFTPIPGIADAYGASATLLEDGRVLFAGGGALCDGPFDGHAGLDNAFTWDPRSGEVQTTGSLNARRILHEAVLLDDGRVLVAGGRRLQWCIDCFGEDLVSELEVWDPATGTWETVGQARMLWLELATLNDGRVAVTGVPDGKGQKSVLVLDPSDDSLTSIDGGSGKAREGAAVTVVDDGRLAIVGGLNERFRPVANAMLWRPGTDAWKTIKYPKAGADTGHTATALPDGQIMVIGGTQQHGKDRVLGTIELWGGKYRLF